MRLDKFLEQQNIGSKKSVRRLLQRKAVTVDGQIVIEENINIDPTVHEIKVAGKRIRGAGHSYFLLNKPQGTVTAVKDAEHQTVIDLIREEDRKTGLYPVGRLDRDTEGLVLITDNGQLGYQLLHPSRKVTKRYLVTVNDRLTEEDCRCFSKGIVFIGGIQCLPAELDILTSSSDRSKAYLDIKEGKFHQVKKMFLSVGKKVTYLKRISIGPIVLEDDLRSGDYRSLNQEEIRQLLPVVKKVNIDRNG
ncbi:16S rRNA pseudouridine(516) synthase [Enterococcus sp. BWT-B8]|uniref:16S rRNA pseudouridine(516) synthase n=1 Tax=Enterococcus sp. BWT-B8 TaxID=2885157 RepID=UPI001E4D1461|nr:16S rRNA pseudouridine(516) synthase [Enterococcus sp. BWT-B8]MCB5952142.1 16S rRNA pseudouridine(516) synthase [Enterococcus sp. BWT-B8]